MPQPNNSFVVVECQTAPNNNKKRVCVPKSWVQCELREKKVAIAYPAEDETRIATRIKNNEPADSGWSHYIGEIKYEAESYVDAIVGFVTNEEKMKKNEKKNCTIKPATNPQDSLKLRIVLPKHKLKSDKKKRSLKKHLKEHTKHKIHKPKQKKLQKQSLKENIPDLKKGVKKETSSDSGVSETAKELYTPCDPKLTCQNNAEQKGLESRIDDIIINSLQDSLKQLNNSNQNTDTSNTTLSECLDFEQDKEIDLSNSNLTSEDRRKLLSLEISQRQTLGYIKAVLIHIKTMYLKVVENKKTLNLIVSKYKDQTPGATVPIQETQQNVKEFEEEGSQSDDMETLRFEDEMEDDNEFEKQPDVAKQNDSTVVDMKQENLLQEMDTKMANDSDFETFIDDEESSLDSFPSLPPSSPEAAKSKNNGISKTNSTWTLKHPHPDKGLVPLGGRKNRVYISAKGLKEVKRVSNNIRMFARLLCKEVFTSEALKTCSMTGKKATGNGSRNIESIRPPLHSHAITVIINYAMSYGKKAGWEDSNIKLSSLLQSLRCMLQRCRKEKIVKDNGKKITYVF